MLPCRMIENKASIPQPNVVAKIPTHTNPHRRWAAALIVNPQVIAAVQNPFAR